MIPHRYPFLLIDRVLELERGKRVVAIKNVTANEPQFTGHFPERPIMPGVLMVEAMAQAGAVAVLSLDENRGQAGPLRRDRRVPVPAYGGARRHAAHRDHRREAGTTLRARACGGHRWW